MNRFFVNRTAIHGELVQFPDDITRQIIRVLRLETGDRVKVLDNSGMVHEVELEVKPNSLEVKGEIITSSREITEAKNELILCFGLSARGKVEWILQKATEVGISKYIPFISTRTLVQSTVLLDHKRLRWERIIQEAAEQSHRTRLPELNPPVDFETCVASLVKECDLCLIAWEHASQLTDRLSQWVQPGERQTVGLLVGPEGGLSETEVQYAKLQGCHVISMGRRILRMETAAVVLPAIVFYQLGDI